MQINYKCKKNINEYHAFISPHVSGVVKMKTPDKGRH